MEDHDFKFDPWKWIKHEDYPDVINKIRKRFKDAGILEMLAELDHMENEPNLDKYIQNTKLDTIKKIIAVKLGLVDNAHWEYLIDTLPGYIEANEGKIQRARAQIQQLAKEHKTHRHDKDKSFSSVPV
jgi:hypothetical protein